MPGRGSSPGGTHPLSHEALPTRALDRRAKIAYAPYAITYVGYGSGVKPEAAAGAPPKRRAPIEAITAETRARLLAVGRRLFAARGFAATSTDALGAAAGLTRGALHYHFDDKRGLFVAVIEQILRELVAGLARDTMKGIPEGTAELERGAALLLEAYGRPEIQRILLRDGPQVLGWQQWIEVQEQSGLAALLDHALAHWVEAGWIERRDVEPTRRLLFGALVHAGVAIADADGSQGGRRTVSRTPAATGARTRAARCRRAATDHRVRPRAGNEWRTESRSERTRGFQIATQGDPCGEVPCSRPC